MSLQPEEEPAIFVFVPGRAGTPPHIALPRKRRWRYMAGLGVALLCAAYVEAKAMPAHYADTLTGTLAGNMPNVAASAGARGQDAEHSAPLHAMHRPGYLGVSLRDLDAAETTRLHRHGIMGAMIVTVDRDAPAWTAGLRPQDVVLEMNGQPVDGVETLRRRLRECLPDDTITLRVRRGEDEMSFSIKLGDQDTVAHNAFSRHLRPSMNSSGEPDPPAPVTSFAWAAPAPPPPPPAATRGMASTLFDALIPGSTYTGLEVDPLTPQLAAFFGAYANSGLLVTAVNTGSPAANAGLLAGDVIVRASNEPVSTRGGLAHALRGAKGNAIPLAILREHKELILSLLPEKRKKL